MKTSSARPQYHEAYGARWSFFIAENAILSENRAAIIAAVDEPGSERNYHLLYGACSTVATTSILSRKQPGAEQTGAGVSLFIDDTTQGVLRRGDSIV